MASNMEPDGLSNAQCLIIDSGLYQHPTPSREDANRVRSLNQPLFTPQPEDYQGPPTQVNGEFTSPQESYPDYEYLQGPALQRQMMNIYLEDPEQKMGLQTFVAPWPAHSLSRRFGPMVPLDTIMEVCAQQFKCTYHHVHLAQVHKTLPQPLHCVRILNPLVGAVQFPVDAIHSSAKITSYLTLRMGTWVPGHVIDMFFKVLNAATTAMSLDTVLAWPVSATDTFYERYTNCPPKEFLIPGTTASRKEAKEVLALYNWHCFPLCTGGHWTVAVYSCKQNSLVLYDSLGGSAKSCPIVRKLAQALTSYLGLSSKITIQDGSCPRQSDYTMCGVCVCRTVDALMEQALDKEPATDPNIIGTCPGPVDYAIEDDGKYRTTMLYWILANTAKWSGVVTSREDGNDALTNAARTLHDFSVTPKGPMNRRAGLRSSRTGIEHDENALSKAIKQKKGQTKAYAQLQGMFDTDGSAFATIHAESPDVRSQYSQGACPSPMVGDSPSASPSNTPWNSGVKNEAVHLMATKLFGPPQKETPCNTIVCPVCCVEVTISDTSKTIDLTKRMTDNRVMTICMNHCRQFHSDEFMWYALPKMDLSEKEATLNAGRSKSKTATVRGYVDAGFAFAATQLALDLGDADNWEHVKASMMLRIGFALHYYTIGTSYFKDRVNYSGAPDNWAKGEQRKWVKSQSIDYVRKLSTIMMRTVPAPGWHLLSPMRKLNMIECFFLDRLRHRKSFLLLPKDSLPATVHYDDGYGGEAAKRGLPG